MSPTIQQCASGNLLLRSSSVVLQCRFMSAPAVCDAAVARRGGLGLGAAYGRSRRCGFGIEGRLDDRAKEGQAQRRNEDIRETSEWGGRQSGRRSQPGARSGRKASEDDGDGDGDGRTYDDSARTGRGLAARQRKRKGTRMQMQLTVNRDTHSQSCQVQVGGWEGR